MMMMNDYPKPTLESDGYMKTFSIDENEAYQSFFDTYGFVVLRDVLSAAECDTSCDEIWDSLEAQEPEIDRQNPLTWTERYWPQSICRNGGFMGKFPYWKRMPNLKETFVAKQPQAWANRTHPDVYDIFRQLLNTAKLWGSIDRYGIMRPTKRRPPVERQEDQQENVDENWATKSEWLHWDLSPFHFGTSAAGFGPQKKMNRQVLRQTYGSLRLQGLVTLTDCPLSTGGFHCVPGFQHQFFQWRDANIDGYGAQEEIQKRNFIEVPDSDEMRQHICQVPMRKGSVLIWNSMLPHGNFPNQSPSEFRMVQYIKMIPVDDSREFKPAISSCKFEKTEWFPENYSLSALGRRMYGLEEWTDDDVEKQHE